MLQFLQLQHMIVVAFLIAASVSDLKKREVPNWVNYGLVVIGVGFGLLQSVIAADWHFLAFSIAGLFSALAIAALMFYTGQWGGGDSKLLIGIGAVFGLSFAAASPFVDIGDPLLSFLVNLVVVSLFYAIAWGGFLAFRSRKRFGIELSRQLKSYSIFRKFLLLFSVVSLVMVLAINDIVVRVGIISLLTTLFFGLYLSILAKAVEKSCMLKQLNPLKLTEGDWIAKDVIISGKRICGPKDLGIEKSQIRQLVSLYRRKKVRTVLIKEGIPFAPSFLIAYLITVFFGNLFIAFVR
ncbi:prepilin peptidase [Candidatus Woesearchaeota archaeon]|nr:prepilin peptidase [Candidatus Woesearchaeota archaeon]